MALERYREIIKRDLNPENREKGIYRGLARCIVNWRRMEAFCFKEDLTIAPLRKEAANMLISFMKNELTDVLRKKQCTSVNCVREELEKFAESLGLEPEDLPDGWPELCPWNC